MCAGVPPACLPRSGRFERAADPLDPQRRSPVDVLREHLDRCRGHVAALDIELPADTYVFSRSPDGSTPLIPSFWGGPNEHAFIGYFPGHAGDRDRFTLAHELGHVILHLRRRTTDPEREANLFAGELLFPSDRARETLGMGLTLSDYARVKAVWGVSMQSLIMRARQLGLISDDRSTSLWKQINARGWRRQEPVTVQPERPALLARLRSHVFGDRPLRELEDELALPVVLLKAFLDPEPARIEERGDNVVHLGSRQGRP